MDSHVNGERIELALVCLHCDGKIELTPEQARRLALGLLAAASGLQPESRLQVRGGDG